MLYYFALAENHLLLSLTVLALNSTYMTRNSFNPVVYDVLLDKHLYKTGVSKRTSYNWNLQLCGDLQI